MTTQQLSATWHESTHAAVAIWLRRPVLCVWRTSGLAWAGEQTGHCLCPVGEKVEPSQVCIALSGYMATGEENWPPPWEQAKQEPLEALGLVLQLLDLSEDQYDQLVALTAEILEHPDFKRLQSAIAKALAAVPRLEAPEIEAICESVGVPPPPREGED